MSADQRIEEAVRKVLGGIAPEADLTSLAADANIRRELDLDSIDFQNFVIGLCRELGVEIPERDVGRLVTVAECVRYLAARCGAAARS